MLLAEDMRCCGRHLTFIECNQLQAVAPALWFRLVLQSRSARLHSIVRVGYIRYMWLVWYQVYHTVDIPGLVSSCIV